MGRKNKPDIILLGISAILIFTGILVLTSVSASISLQKTGTTFYFLNRQILLGLLPGLLLGTIAFFTPIDWIKKLSPLALLLNLVLLGMVFLPVIGSAASPAHRWIYFGPFSFQPAELLKLTLILYIAAWLSMRTEKSKRSRERPRFLRPSISLPTLGDLHTTFLPFAAIMIIVSLFLILQPDIGTLGVIAATAIIIYFVAATPPWHTIFMIAAGFAGFLSLIYLAPYRASRLAVFLNPSLDPLGQGYQIKQALIGIGSGGLTGVGLGLSFQKFGALPEPISDSIFAVINEEAGFIGGFLLVFLFLAFAWRSLSIARRVSDSFSRLVVVGITFWITIQAFVNMGAIVAILPLTGIPLPFVSYGGSALFSELLALGILLNISKQQV